MLEILKKVRSRLRGFVDWDYEWVVIQGRVRCRELVTKIWPLYLEITKLHYWKLSNCRQEDYHRIVSFVYSLDRTEEKVQECYDMEHMSDLEWEIRWTVYLMERLLYENAPVGSMSPPVKPLLKSIYTGS